MKTLHQESMCVVYTRVNVCDASRLATFSKESLHPVSSVVFFHVKPATFNFLLSLLCGPPFMPVTEPRTLTMSFNLISALIWSNLLINDKDELERAAG